MPLPYELQQFFIQNNGIITTAQANLIGFSNERLRLLVKDGSIERVADGIYILPDEFVDRMHIIQLKRSKAIYSHEALFLHGLTDRDPINYTVTVPTGYNTTGLRADGLNVYTINNKLHHLGVMYLESMFRNKVSVYNMERTICDCLRSRNQMDIAVVTEDVKLYADRKDKNLNTLMQMADVFKVTQLLKTYMEVLL